MKHRSVIAVLLLTIVTLGIYAIVWHVKTKGEMVRQGAQIPTAWLIIVPLANIYWLWKYSQGVDHVTKSKISTILAFLVLFLLSIIGMAIIQNEFNQVATDNAPAQIPDAPYPTIS